MKKTIMFSILLAFLMVACKGQNTAKITKKNAKISKETTKKTTKPSSLNEIQLQVAGMT